MPTLAHYMAQYDYKHGSVWNRVLHDVGIPLILAGVIFLLFMKWVSGAGFFLAGWALLFFGHRIEGNNPAFFQGPIYLLVGPIWVAKEVWMFLKETHRKPAPAGAPEATARK